MGATKPGQMNFVLNEPLGVVVHILPFNYPIVLLAWRGGRAGGRQHLHRQAQRADSARDAAPWRGLRRLFGRGLHVVTATGSGAGRLVEHPGTDMIAFTGSVAVGSRIMAAAAPRIKKLLLEASVDPIPSSSWVMQSST